MKIQPIYIGLGSNLGDREMSITKAIHKISELSQTNVLKVSSLYESTPVGEVLQDNFLNAVCCVESAMVPRLLLEELKNIEQELGRPDTYKRWHPRPIDLDILLYDDWIVNEENLTIPHPELQNRKFVLIPLLEIGNPTHPVFKKKMDKLFSAIRTKDGVEKYRMKK